MWRASLVALAVVLIASSQLGCRGASPTPAPNGPADTPAATPEPAPEGPQIQLHLDQPAEVDGLVLTWLSFEDSRCPQGVMCVWAGEALVRIRVRDAGGESEISLKLGSQPEEGAAKTARHEIRLTAVEPYPTHGSDVAREARRASVVVKRL